MKRVPWTGTGTGDDPRRPDLPEGTGYSVVEDHGDGTVTVDTGPDPREGEALKVAARVAVEAKVKAGDLPDEDVATLSLLYDPWTVGEAVTVGDLRSWDGTVIEALQAHTTQADWTPGATPALWKIHRKGSGAQQGEIPADWVQPTGAHDTYNIGDRVTYQAQVWVSTVDNNSWAPDVFGWEVEQA